MADEQATTEAAEAVDLPGDLLSDTTQDETADADAPEASEQKTEDAEPEEKPEPSQPEPKMSMGDLRAMARKNHDRAVKAEARLMRYEIAAAKGMPFSLAVRLIGRSRSEVEADADRLMAELGRMDADKPRSRPTEKLHSGAVPASEPEDTDPRSLAAKVPRLYS